jgi:hypothetical protein
MIIGRRAAEETLIGSATLKRGGGLAVYEENSRGDSLSPEMRSKGRGDVLTSRLRTKNTNGRIILGTDHGSKLLVNRKKIASRGHQINPSKPRIVIDEQNII